MFTNKYNYSEIEYRWQNGALKHAFVNAEAIDSDGVYIYDDRFGDNVTPETSMTRVDVVVVEGIVAKVFYHGARAFIPNSNGFVLSLCGRFASLSDELTVGEALYTIDGAVGSTPERFALLGDSLFTLYHVNEKRYHGMKTVLYTSEYGTHTGTYDFFTEITVANGKVVNIGHGNSEIPENGAVVNISPYDPCFAELSKVSVGDVAYIEGDEKLYRVFLLKYTGVNCPRDWNDLIVYSDGKSTGTNEFGFEIAVDKNGVVVDSGYDGDLAIPAGGYVLSGHGESKDALVNAYINGAKAVIDSDSGEVLIIKTPSLRLTTARKSVEVARKQFDNAKSQYLNIDYRLAAGELERFEAELVKAEELFKSCCLYQALACCDAVVSDCESLSYKMIETKYAENRAMWYRAREKDDDAVRRTLNRFKNLGGNALYLETWYEGVCIGQKVDVEGVVVPEYFGDYDVLEAFIRIGHELGVEIHAWVHDFFVGFYYDDGRNYYNTYFDKFKSKYLVDCKGRDFFYYSANNNKFIFLNPFDRECRDYVLSIYEQLVTRYDLDGLQLDYIRLPELNYETDDFGYNDDIVAAFKEKTGITDDPRTFKATSPENWEKWVQFRCDIITSFACEVHDMLKKNKPSVWLSAATYPEIDEFKYTIMQDVKGFVASGVFDELFSMSYAIDNRSMLHSVNGYIEATKDKTFYSAGLAAFLETTKESFAQQLAEAELAGADGIAVFSLTYISPFRYEPQIEKGAFRSPSVQVTKLEKTVLAQVAFIKEKLNNLAPIGAFSPDFVTEVYETCARLKGNSLVFNSDKASCEDKIAFCDKIVGLIASMKDCADSESEKNLLADFCDLSYWMSLTKHRLETRI